MLHGCRPFHDNRPRQVRHMPPGSLHHIPSPVIEVSILMVVPKSVGALLRDWAFSVRYLQVLHEHHPLTLPQARCTHSQTRVLQVKLLRRPPQTHLYLDTPTVRRPHAVVIQLTRLSVPFLKSLPTTTREQMNALFTLINLMQSCNNKSTLRTARRLIFAPAVPILPIITCQYLLEPNLRGIEAALISSKLRALPVTLPYRVRGCSPRMLSVPRCGLLRGNGLLSNVHICKSRKSE